MYNPLNSVDPRLLVCPECCHQKAPRRLPSLLSDFPRMLAAMGIPRDPVGLPMIFHAIPRESRASHTGIHGASHGIPRRPTETHTELPMGTHRSSKVPIFHGFPRVPVGLHRLPRAPTSSHGLQLVFAGSQELQRSPACPNGLPGPPQAPAELHKAPRASTGSREL